MSSPHPNDDNRFDRLVDGELSESERRDLLTSLDDEPGGWRRCALAFLEAQTWKQGLGALLRPSAPVAAAVPRTVARNRLFRDLGGIALAMAASFLLALGLAGYWHGGGNAVGPSGNGTNLAHHTGSTNSQVPTVPPTSLSGSNSSPWQMVGLPASGDSTMVIPATQRDHWDDQWLNNTPSAMPPNVMHAFERTGHRVERRQNLVPVRLDDGRVLVVPVEQMDIQPAPRPVY